MRTQQKEMILYFGLIFGCIVSFPISTPYLDLVVVLGYLILNFKVLHKSDSNFSQIVQSHFLSLIFFFYLAIRDITSLVAYYNIKTVRILLVHAVLFIFIIFSQRLQFKQTNYKTVLHISIAYFLFYVLYYTYIFMTGQDWGELQTVYITGSVYAAIPFLFISYLILENSTNKTLFLETVLILLVLISAVIYSSRTLLLFILIFLFLFMIKSPIALKFRISFVAVFVFCSVFLSLFFGVFVSHSNSSSDARESHFQSQQIENQLMTKESDFGVSSINDGKTISENKLENFLKDVASSALFLVNTRPSDEDRISHISCAIEAIKFRDLQSNLFGSGSNSYRYTMSSCTQFGGEGYRDSETSRFGKGILSITFNVLIIDYGLFPLVLLILIFAKNLVGYFRKDVPLVYLIYFVLHFYLFFVTNLSASLIVWLYLTFSGIYLVKPASGVNI